MSTSISADVGNLRCFPTFFLSNLFFIALVCLLFCNIIMTEPMHTALKEMRASELMFRLNTCPSYQLLTQK